MPQGRNYEDLPEWTPPSYALPATEEWSPPDYASLADDEEVVKKPSRLGRIKEAILHPKPFNPSGIKIPEKEELPNPSSAERIAAANALVDPGPGDYFARHPEGKHSHEEAVKGFTESVASASKSEPRIEQSKIGPEDPGIIEKTKRVLKEGYNKLPTDLESLKQFGKDILTYNAAEGDGEHRVVAPGTSTKSILPEYKTMFNEPDTYLGGFRKGLYENFIQPLASEAGVFAGIAGAGPRYYNATMPPIINETPLRIGEAPSVRRALPEAFTEGEILGDSISSEPPIRRPAPTRSPNLDPNRFDIEGAEIPISKGKNVEELRYELAKKKFGMGEEIPPEEIRISGPIREIPEEPSIKQPFVNPFEKNAAKIAPGDIPDPKGQYFWNTEGFGPEGYEQGMWMEKDAMNSDVMSPIQRKEFGPENQVKQPGVPAVRPDITEGFGGSGHPESPEYVAKVLGRVEKGKPGLSIEPLSGDAVTDIGTTHVVYRGSNGEPIAVAKIVKDQQGNNMVMDLAADKSKGLATGRAMQALGKKLVELKATKAAGTMSPDAQNFRDRMKRRTPEEQWAPPSYAKSESSEAWKPPDYAKIEEPEAARTESGKLAIGADVKSLGKVLGTSLYKGDIAPIATKELLQNSIDAVRHLGEKGEIHVAFNREDGTIHVQDNGKGLTRQELESVFTDLGASGKRDDATAAGGFGLAKAAPLLGGKKVEVSSITRDLNGKLHEYSFSGTPNELLEGVDIKHRIPNENEKTGTSVKVHVPQNSEFYQAKHFVEHLSKYSPSVQSKIRVADMTRSSSKPEDYYMDFPRGKHETLETLENPSATTELSTPKNTRRGSRGYLELKLSNNGMYQGTKTMYFNSEIPNLPDSVTVDIRPKVPEGHADYPFTANREELRGSVEEQVKKYIEDNIVKPGIGKRLDELKKLYASMQEITVGKGEFPNSFGHKISIYDPKGQITPAEMKTITENPAFQTLAGNIAGTLKEALKVTGEPSWSDRLEKIGIIFDDSVHGIHIPNPGSGKSAILINPFVAIGDMNPDEASANILHTILHELAHVDPDANVGHNESFTIRLGEIYGKFGARRSVEAQEQIGRAIGNSNTGIYHPAIQEILHTYQESRRREATTDDLLSGTGIKSGSGGRGKGDISKGDRSDGEGTVKKAVDKLLESIKENRGLMEEQEHINKTERAKRFAAFASVKQGGAAGAAKSLGKLSGEYEKVDPAENLMLDKKETDILFTAIKRSKKLTEPEKARGITALFKLLNGEKVPQRSELQVLEDVFGSGFGADIINMHGGIGAVGIKLSKLANTMKTMQSSVDLSAPMRQGAGLMYRKEFRPAFVDMFKFFADKEFYDYSMREMTKDPVYHLGRESGLFLSKPGSIMEAEEAFLNSYIGDLPKMTGIPMATAASERAYVGFLNKLRFDTFKSMIKKAQSLGHESHTVVEQDGEQQIVPSQSSIKIAKFINNASGRGELGKLNKITQELNMLLWSPRMISSRINMLANPKIYMDLPKGMRREGLKSLFGMAGFSLMSNALAAAAGATISYNILSSDFMKSRFGNNKIMDPNAGLQQYVVAAARFLAGKTDSKTPTNRLKIAGSLLANKEAPIVSLAHTILTSKPTKGGQPGDITTQYGEKTSIQSQVGKQFVPMLIQDVYSLVESDADWSEDIGLNTVLGAAGSLGVGIQSYPEKKKGGLLFRKMKLQ